MNESLVQQARTIGDEVLVSVAARGQAAAFGGLILVRNSLRPLRAITEQAERISSANLSQRLPVARTGDEVERLAISIFRDFQQTSPANCARL